jgi:hypothetical protein
MIKTVLLAISLISASCALAGDQGNGPFLPDESLPYIQKEYPCIVYPSYKGKIEIQSDGDVQWQMFITGGGRYCNVWAMYPDQYKSWEKAGKPQPHTPEYSAWCKANPPRYRM